MAFNRGLLAFAVFFIFLAPWTNAEEEDSKCGESHTEERMELVDFYNEITHDHIPAAKDSAKHTFQVLHYNSQGSVGYLSKTNGGFGGCKQSCMKKIYRMFNKETGDHFLTTQREEIRAAEASGFTFDGDGGATENVGYCVKEKACGTDIQLLRLYNKKKQDHILLVHGLSGTSQTLEEFHAKGYKSEGSLCWIWSSA